VSKSIFASFVSLAFVASFAAAKFPGFGHSSEKAATIDVAQSVQVPNGPVLKAGSYKVFLMSDSATTQVGFYQDGKLVGQAPVQMVDQGSKSDVTEVHTDTTNGNAVVTEIDVNGWTKSIQFGQRAGGSGQSGR